MSKIEWTDETWNPIVGCSVVSPGCTNCYAMRQARRHDRSASHYRGTTKASRAGPIWSGKVAPAPEHILYAPRRWRSPKRIFVNSMGDLFHENVPDSWIDLVIGMMILAPRHRFQLLTKRADRMRRYFAEAETDHVLDWGGRWIEAVADLNGDISARVAEENAVWPIPNLWLGISAEDQTRFDERWTELRQTAAVVRFISFEPLLGQIRCSWSSETNRPVPDWAIAGGESGAGARPMHPDWARSLRDQCNAQGIPYFFKQHGDWTPEPRPGAPSLFMTRDGRRFDDVTRDASAAIQHAVSLLGDELRGKSIAEHGVAQLWRVGKKRAGRELDGREWNEMPVPRKPRDSAA